MPLITCPKCGEFDSACNNCMAYRHVLKEIARSEGDSNGMVNIANCGLSEERIYGLAKVLHRIVKAAVQADMAFMKEDPEKVLDAMRALHEVVAELPWTGVVVQGWLKGK